MTRNVSRRTVTVVKITKTENINVHMGSANLYFGSLYKNK